MEGASVWSCKGLVIQLRLCQRATILQSSVWRQKSRGEFDSMLWASAARASCTGDLRVDSAGDRWLDPVGGHLLRFFYDEGNTRAKRDNRSVDRPNVCGWQSLDRLTQKKKSIAGDHGRRKYSAGFLGDKWPVSAKRRGCPSAGPCALSGQPCLPYRFLRSCIEGSPRADDGLALNGQNQHFSLFKFFECLAVHSATLPPRVLFGAIDPLTDSFISRP